MSAGPLHKTLEPLRQLVGAQFFSGWPDHRLLELFLVQRDQPAFAELVHRHRRLVWSVCRQLLGHEQDAEDAFQATFLVLALKARSIRKRQALAGWLYGVAYRCAMQIKRQEARRKRHEQAAAKKAAIDPAGEINLREAWAVLAEEVNRLPENHRAPFVLCCLEGKSQEEAGRLLGWKTGTVSGRLARARMQLQKRLARHGIPLGAVLGVGALGEMEVSAAVLSSTTCAAQAVMAGVSALTGEISSNVLALVKGVSKAMLFTKIKSLTVVLFLAGILAGAGLAAQQVFFQDKGPPAKLRTAEQPKDQHALAKKQKPDENLRYDGKPFEYWRDFVTSELKSERRIDAIRAMGAFGVRGYAKEASAVVVNLMKEYGVKEDIRPVAMGMLGGQLSGLPDQKVVAEAYMALAKIGPHAIPVMLQNLEHDKIRAFVTLGFWNGTFHLPESSVPVLVRLIGQEKKEVSQCAFEILAAPWAKTFLPEGRYWGHFPNKEQWQAILASTKVEKDLKNLIRSLSRIVEENPSASSAGLKVPIWPIPRVAAAEILGRLGSRAREAGPALIKAALENDQWAKIAVLQIKPAPKLVVSLIIPALKKSLELQKVAADLLRLQLVKEKSVHDSANALGIAVELLAAQGAAAAPVVPLLLQALAPFPPYDEERFLPEILQNQLAVLHALEKIRPDKKQVVPVLVKILADKTRDPLLQSEALGLLVKLETDFEPFLDTLTVYLERQIVPFTNKVYSINLPGQPAVRDGSGPAIGMKMKAIRQVAEIIQKLGPRAKKTMPVLLQSFKFTEEKGGLLPPGIPGVGPGFGPVAPWKEARLAIIHTWAKMGSAARDALPVLYQLLAGAQAEMEESLRAAAQEAIKAISK